MATLRSNYTQEAANGAYSTSTTTAFTIPVRGGSDDQEFNDISWVSMGQPVYFADGAGTTWGFFKVVGIDVDNKKLALQNEWNEIGGGTTIPVGSKLSPGASPLKKNELGEIIDFETTAQLDARDVLNRERVNHTGTQAISTVDGLQGALDSKEPADATILKQANIGVTVQPYDVNTVIDPTYIPFTSAEQVKLAGIADGAEVNVNPDWNAVSGDAFILNKPTLSTVATTGAYSDLSGLPTLGTAAATDSTAYATSAQGAKANSALQPTDIGVSVQAYNANTVIDPTYIATENNYTTVEKNKLAGIAEGAEVNVNADWNAVSGDAHILNKPTVYTTTNSATPPVGAIEGDTWWDSETGDKYIYYVDADGGQWVQSSSSSNLLTADVGTALQPSDIGTTVAPVNNPTFTGTALILPNNSRINGIEHFYQTTKPTVRGDGSALVSGDRWWKTDDGTEWFWNGTYWLGAQRLIFTEGRAIVNATSYGTSVQNYISGLTDASIPGKTNSLFLEKMICFARCSDGLGDINNYYTIELTRLNLSGSVVSVASSSALFFSAPYTDVSEEVILNTVVPSSTSYSGTRGFAMLVRATGSPPSYTSSTLTAYFREIFS